MNDKTLHALDRALNRLERDARRPPRRGFSSASIVLVLGQVVGYQLLARFVPLVWAQLLPEGLEQARALRGWPGLVWGAALFCHHRFTTIVSTGAIVAVIGSLMGRGPWPCRVLTWLAAVTVILLDAGIVYVALRTSMEATMQGSNLFG